MSKGTIMKKSYFTAYILVFVIVMDVVLLGYGVYRNYVKSNKQQGNRSAPYITYKDEDGTTYLGINYFKAQQAVAPREKTDK